MNKMFDRINKALDKIDPYVILNKKCLELQRTLNKGNFFTRPYYEWKANILRKEIDDILSIVDCDNNAR